MKKTHTFAILAFVFLLVTSLNVFAATVTNTINSQPTNVYANHDYTVNWSVVDSANNTVNSTAKFYVNGVNVANSTNNNHNSTAPSNTFLATFSHSYYEQGDTVFTNITTVEAGNNSVSDADATSSKTVEQSTSVLISSDLLDGLPSIGTAIGDFMGNLIPGLFKFILLIGIGVAVVGLIVAIIFVIKNKGSGSLKFK